MLHLPPHETRKCFWWICAIDQWRSAIDRSIAQKRMTEIPRSYRLPSSGSTRMPSFSPHLFTLCLVIVCKQKPGRTSSTSTRHGVDLSNTQLQMMSGGKSQSQMQATATKRMLTEIASLATVEIQSLHTPISSFFSGKY